jgi:hypothetical protein
MNRQTLERYVLADLFSRDTRFAPRSRKWARLALDLKSLTLDGAAPEVILEELEHRMARIEIEPDDEPEIVREAVQVAEQLDAESGAAEYAYLNG